MPCLFLLFAPRILRSDVSRVAEAAIGDLLAIVKRKAIALGGTMVVSVAMNIDLRATAIPPSALRPQIRLEAWSAFPQRRIAFTRLPTPVLGHYFLAALIRLASTLQTSSIRLNPVAIARAADLEGTFASRKA